MAEDVDTFRQLFDASRHPMWMFDRTTRQFIAVNDSAVTLFGWSREELLAMRLDDVRPPEERAAMADENGLVHVDCEFCAKSFPVALPA